MKDIADRELVERLLDTIKEIYTIVNKRNKIYDYTKYPDPRIDLIKASALDQEKKYIYWHTENTSDLVLSVRKPKKERCPQPSSIIEKWIQGKWSDYSVQTDHVVSLPNSSERFSDSEQRIKAYQLWKEKRTAWQEKEKKAEPIRKVYELLYQIYEQFEREEEVNELVFAFGLFSNTSQAPLYIHHPLFTKRLRISNERIKDHIIDVYETENDVVFNTELIADIEDISIANLRNIRDELDTDINIYDIKEVKPFLENTINWLTNSGEYITSSSGMDFPYEYTIQYRPTILMRKRTSGLRDFLEKAQKALREGMTIPPHLLGLLRPKDREKVVNPAISTNDITTRLAAVSGEDMAIYMTKPANKEQLRIAQEIAINNAVEVQGPPGTGKTHTIANLMGHFLAQGKTILVTSETKKALQVLRDKLEADIQPLCVSVLDGKQDEMQTAITSILGKIHTMNTLDMKQRIHDTSKIRDKLSANLDTERSYIYSIRNRQSQQIDMGNGNVYSVDEMAQQLAVSEDLLSWIPGPVKKQGELPLSKDEFRTLYHSNRELSMKECLELRYQLPAYTELLEPHRLQELLKSLEEYQGKLEAIPAITASLVQYNFNEQQIYYDHDLLFSSPTANTIQELQQIVKKLLSLTDWQCDIIQATINGKGYSARWEKLVELIHLYLEKK